MSAPTIGQDVVVLFALGVALFPISGSRLEQVVHLTSAAALFLVLAFFALFLFTKSGDFQTHAKRLRNRVYRVCGVVMVVCIGLIAVYQLRFTQTAAARLNPVFWLETIALWAFGFSWFVKGEAILND